MHFIFDANLPLRLAKGLVYIDNDNLREIKVQISHADELCGPGHDDRDVIIKAHELGGIIISEDDDFKRIKENKALIRKLGVGYVLYKAPQKRGSLYWDKAKAIILAWEPLKARIRASSVPFIMNIDRKGNIHQEL